jgi:hypothetical protein
VACTAAVLLLAMIPAVSGAPAPARADEVTASQDLLRTGWDRGEPALTPAAVSGSGFGQLFSTAVNGQVYAQPLVVGSTVIVATENDMVYGLNASSGVVKWSRSLGTPWTTVTPPCNDLAPDIGDTSTPVYDPSTSTVWLVAATVVNSAPQYNFYGISAATGAIAAQKAISGSPANDSSVKFNAAQEWQRPGLLLLNGWVYAAFASHCDNSPWDGFVSGMNSSTHATTLWSAETGLTENKAGIWQSGGGLMSDGSGRIFFASGNGVSPAPGKGSSPPGQLAESVVRLAVQSGGALAATDFFSPKSAPTLDAQDLDLGSGSPVGLPFGTTQYPSLLVQGTKDGRIYVLNRTNLGGREQGANGSDATVHTICCFAGLWGHPAVFANTTTLTTSSQGSAANFLYYVAKNDYLREMRWSIDSSGRPSLHTVANSSFTFGYTSGSPAVTSNGTSASSAIVWEIGATGATGTGGTLYAFRAVPASTCTSSSPCKLSPLWSAPIGTASKFAIPATGGGRIYVGTRDGHVLGFGIRTAAAAAPLSAAPVTFTQTTVGATSTSMATVTAAAKTTVSGVSTNSADVTEPFTVGRVIETKPGSGTKLPVTFPVALAKGDALHASVSYHPTTPGGSTGAVSFAVKSAHLPSVNVPLFGNGIHTGLFATPGSLTIAQVSDHGVFPVPVGTSELGTVDITNTGTSPQTVTGVTKPAAPFTATQLPAPGTVIRPGQSVTVLVTFAPKQAGGATGSLTIRGSSGPAAAVRLSGTAVPAMSKFVATPAAVIFGAVPVGHQAVAVVDIKNAGNQPALAAGSKLHAPFGTLFSVAEGLPVNPGDDLKLRITFAPAHAGKHQFLGVYTFTWTDPLGIHTLHIHLSGTGTG